jgi:hypothetical protein
MKAFEIHPYPLRVFTDDEVLSARDETELVTLLNVTRRRGDAPAETDAEFMRSIQVKFKLTGGVLVRCDTPQNFIADLIRFSKLALINKEFIADPD